MLSGWFCQNSVGLCHEHRLAAQILYSYRVPEVRKEQIAMLLILSHGEEVCGVSKRKIVAIKH